MYSVVIADDEKIITDTIQTVLKSTVPELDTLHVFYNGLDVYKYIQTNHADILLLDIEMPAYSGLDITRLINEQKIDSYVIIISAFQNFEYAQKAVNFGANAFLIKPFSSQQLTDAVRKGMSVLAERRSSTTYSPQMYLALVQSFLINDILPLNEEFNFFTNMHCTEVQITNNDSYSFGGEKLEALLAKYDSSEQHVYIREYKENILKLLVFFKNEPDLAFIQDILEKADNADQLSVLHKTYASFTHYRLEQSFFKAMQSFTQVLSSGSSYQAKEQLTTYLSSLNEEQLKAFADYLYENYQLLPANADISSILDCIATLTIRILNANSGNYLVSSTKKYIKEHYNEPNLSLESVADALSVSSVYLSRIFKNQTAQNFSEYLQDIRIEHAKLLLKSTSQSTDQIASAVGYNSTTYFRHCFKASCGMTPKQYRQIQFTKEGSFL